MSTRDLEAVRPWVVDAAANVPQNPAGERMLLPIVQEGIGQVIDIVQRSNGDLNAIGSKIRGLGGEYQLLGNQSSVGPRKAPSSSGRTERRTTRRNVDRPRRAYMTHSQGTGMLPHASTPF
jgi:hypothetical protein